MSKLRFETRLRMHVSYSQEACLAVHTFCLSLASSKSLRIWCRRQAMNWDFLRSIGWSVNRLSFPCLLYLNIWRHRKPRLFIKLEMQLTCSNISSSKYSSAAFYMPCDAFQPKYDQVLLTWDTLCLVNCTKVIKFSGGRSGRWWIAKMIADALPSLWWLGDEQFLLYFKWSFAMVLYVF